MLERERDHTVRAIGHAENITNATLSFMNIEIGLCQALTHRLFHQLQKHVLILQDSRFHLSFYFFFFHLYLYLKIVLLILTFSMFKF